MADRDETITRLKCLIAYIHSPEGVTMNGMNKTMLILEIAARDAIELLEGQEAVEPLRPRARGRVERFWVCSECGAEIDKGDRFCRYCGRETKWED